MGGSLLLAGGGDQTPHTLYLLEQVFSVLKAPRTFFVMIGTNNIGNNWSSAESTAAGVRSIVATLRTRFPESRILLHAVLPRADDEIRMDVKANAHLISNLPWQATIDRLNNELLASAREGPPSVEFLDCGHVFPRGSGPEAFQTMPDLLHPNAEGYELWF